MKKFGNTAKEQVNNRRWGSRGTSKYKGVYFSKGKWVAQFRKEYLGRFNTEQEAYDRRKQREVEAIFENMRTVTCRVAGGRD